MNLYPSGVFILSQETNTQHNLDGMHDRAGLTADNVFQQY